MGGCERFFFFPSWRDPAGLSCWCHQPSKQHFTQ